MITNNVDYNEELYISMNDELDKKCNTWELKISVFQIFTFGPSD